MPKIKNVTAIILSVFIVLYLIFSPRYIFATIEKGRVPFWQRKEESFNGIIELWHIVGFKPHTGSVSSWLGNRTKEFEKKHHGVFVNITSMTIEDYYKKKSLGMSADIYSVPLGLEYSDSYYKLNYDCLFESLPYIRSDFINSGMSKNQIIALPFLYSGYCLITNDSLLTAENQITIPFTSNDISEISKNMSAENNLALCGNPIIAGYYGISTPIDSYDKFKTGNAPLSINDFRSVGDIERRQDAKNSFPISSYSITDFTDLVQYVAFDKNISEVKLPYAYEFISKLYSDKAQSSLALLNCYPVINFENPDKLLKEYNSIAFNAFSLYYSPKIPNFFLYKRHYDKLIEEAELSFLGDIDAKTRFANRIKEILSID